MNEPCFFKQILLLKHIYRVTCLVFLAQIGNLQAFATSMIEKPLSQQSSLRNSSVSMAGEFQPILPMGNIKTVSSHFGNRIDPFTGLWESHQGVDYPAVTGTPILAVANGTVTQAGYSGGYGNLVEIDHGQGYTSKYGHASQILTRMGQQVQKGQVIALVGSTGHSTGPHLHFEMAQYGQVFNPMAFLNQGLQLGTTASNNPNSGGWNKPSSYPSGQKNTKAFFSTGEMIVAVRVRSGKPVKW